MKLPSMTFNLPPRVGLENLEIMQRQAVRLQSLSRCVGTGSNAFRQRLIALYDAAQSGERLADLCTTPQDVRAVTYLWDNKDLLAVADVTPELLNRFRSIRDHQGSMVLFGLMNIFFKHFDQLPNYEYLGEFLQKELHNFQRKRPARQVALIKKHANKLFCPDGPGHVLAYRQRYDLDLMDACNALGLPVSGRFVDVCKFHYYIETIKTLSPGQKHAVFDEVTKPSVFECHYKDGRMIGHEVIKAIIDTVYKKDSLKPGEWLTYILNIAGDPRVPLGTQRYQRWWIILGASYTQKVRRWLSHFDLKLFLEILEDYVNKSEKEDLQRMFPARKVFLEGLDHLELIEDSRLFVGRAAANYLRRRYQARDLPSYSTLVACDTSKSILYLSIKGRGVIEGSHSFPMLIFDALPDGHNLQNYSQGQYEERELNQKLKKLHERDSKSRNSFRIVHYPNLNWQNRAIEAFAMLGVRVPADKVLTSVDYRKYKRKYGVW